MIKYNCEFDSIIGQGREFRARIKMLEDHKEMGGRKGEFSTTSKIKSINFERGIIITQNSIYLFEGF